MTLWLPDFGGKEMIELTLESEGIEFEYASDNIIICQADATLYEFLQLNCRKVIPVNTDKPSVEIPMRENELDVDIPACIPEDADAAAAAAEAIEADIKSKIKKSEEEDDTKEKQTICENIFRVMHNRKLTSCSLDDIKVVNENGREIDIVEVARVKGKTNVVEFTCVSVVNGREARKKASSTSIIKSECVEAKILKNILKQVNHFK